MDMSRSTNQTLEDIEKQSAMEDIENALYGWNSSDVIPKLVTFIIAEATHEELTEAIQLLTLKKN